MKNTNDKSKSRMFYYDEIGTTVEVSTADISIGTTSTISVTSPSVCIVLNDIRDLDIDHGFIPFIMDGDKRCLIGIRGRYRDIMLFINIDNGIYEEYIFSNIEQIKVISVANELKTEKHTCRVKAKFFISEDYGSVEDIEIVFFYSNDGIYNYYWTDPFMNFAYLDKLKIMKIYRKHLIHCCRSDVNEGKKVSDYEVGVFSQFTRGERLILADHLEEMNGIMKPMHISVVKPKEYFNTKVSIRNIYCGRDNSIDRLYATTDVGTKKAKTIIFDTSYFSLYNIDKMKMFLGVDGYRYIVFANGISVQCITLINLDKQIGYEYEFDNATNINIDDVFINIEEACARKNVKIIGTLTYFDKDDKPINDLEFTIRFNSPDCRLDVDNFKITDARFNNDECAKIIESFSTVNQKSVIFIDNTASNCNDHEKEACDDSDDEMEVLSAPENAFFKEFRELMDKISSHVLSYGASINMSSNDRIKVCSFIDSINEVIEKYNKK